MTTLDRQSQWWRGGMARGGGLIPTLPCALQVLALGTLGAPIRQYQLTDLLLDACPSGGGGGQRTQGNTRTHAHTQTGCVPTAGLRLAIFTNAHVLPDAIRCAIGWRIALVGK